MKRTRGFSLVELMIAVALGLLVTTALVSMFVGVRSASRTTSGVGALADSGRFALDTIEQSVRGAGNFACNSTAPVAVAGIPLARQLTLLNPDATSLVATDFGEPLSGYEATNTSPGQLITVATTPAADNTASDWATTNALGNILDPALVNPPLPQGMAAPVGSPIGGSDVLVVHETLPSAIPAYTNTVATGGGAFVVDSASVFSAGGGQIGVISNCAQTEVFQVATFAGGGGIGTINLAGAAISPGNNSGTLSAGIDFGIGSQVAPADSIVFYIGVGADGDGALYKYETNGGVFGDGYSVNEELVPDVENMQILYGVETGASQTTQTVAQYVTANNVATTSITGDFNGVISVQIALLVASPPSTVPPGTTVAAPTPPLLGTNWQISAADSRMRQVYEQTMFLRNMSP